MPASLLVIQVKAFPAEKLQKIFDPFYTTKPVGQGTGLGLSISYDIVRKHDGEIQVQSELNKGSKFTVMLPLSLSEEKND